MGAKSFRITSVNGPNTLHGTAVIYTVPVGTSVRIINTPIKASVEPDGSRLVEVHQPLSKAIDDDPIRYMPL